MTDYSYVSRHDDRKAVTDLLDQVSRIDAEEGAAVEAVREKHRAAIQIAVEALDKAREAYNAVKAPEVQEVRAVEVSFDDRRASLDEQLESFGAILTNEDGEAVHCDASGLVIFENDSVLRGESPDGTEEIYLREVLVDDAPSSVRIEAPAEAAA